MTRRQVLENERLFSKRQMWLKSMINRLPTRHSTDNRSCGSPAGPISLGGGVGWVEGEGRVHLSYLCAELQASASLYLS